MVRSAKPNCRHEPLQLDCAPHGESVGFHRRTAAQRIAATALAGAKSGQSLQNAQWFEDYSDTFPGPLCLPGDCVPDDPKYPPQSFRSWYNLPRRNRVSSERRTIYVAGPPKPPPGMPEVQEWTRAQLPKQTKRQATKPSPNDIIEYLAAFYHPLSVKRLPVDLRFTPWDNPRKRKHSARSSFSNLSLLVDKELIQIRARGPSNDGFYKAQLLLNDLLDVAIELVPDDAYALLMIVDHDIFEDEDDDFACGRAYGGSRIAVVSTARYNPALDDIQKIDRLHSWPASHCAAYVEDMCAKAANVSEQHNIADCGKKEIEPIAPPRAVDGTLSSTSPMQAALDSFSSSLPDPYPLYLARVARTAAHEVGHCFGIGHCMYFACAMQGTCSLVEDVRQPPYVCPVDWAKILRATGGTERQWLEAMRVVCEKWKAREGKGGFWTGFEAWIGAVLQGLEKEGGENGHRGDMAEGSSREGAILID